MLRSGDPNTRAHYFLPFKICDIKKLPIPLRKMESMPIRSESFMLFGQKFNNVLIFGKCCALRRRMRSNLGLKYYDVNDGTGNITVTYQFSRPDIPRKKMILTPKDILDRLTEVNGDLQVIYKYHQSGNGTTIKNESLLKDLGVLQRYIERESEILKRNNDINENSRTLIVGIPVRNLFSQEIEIRAISILNLDIESANISKKVIDNFNNTYQLLYEQFNIDPFANNVPEMLHDSQYGTSITDLNLSTSDIEMTNCST